MRISVFVTSYNQKDYLQEAIESVLAQTLRPLEIIVVDDASRDQSRDAIAGFASRYPELVVPIYHEQNQGVARTRIDALRVVSGDYVTYVDGDDRLLPTKLEKEAELLRHNPSAQIAFSDNYYISAEGVRTGTWAESETPPEGDIFCETFARRFPRRNLFRMELVEYRAWKQIGFHDVELALYEDYDMRIRLTKRLRTAYIDEPLSEIRLHADGLSSLPATVHLEALDYILSKNEPLLANLGSARREAIQQDVHQWMARIGQRAADEAWIDAVKQLRNGRPARAMALWSEYQRHRERFSLPKKVDWRLTAQALLPSWTYEQLRRAYQAVRGDSAWRRRLEDTP